MKRRRVGQSVLVIGNAPASLINFRGPLLRAMRDAGHEVVAAAPALYGDRAAVAELESLGIRCHDIPLNRTGLNPLADARLLASLVRLMRAERPEAVLAYTIKAVIFGLTAAAVARVPRRYALVTGLGYAFTGAVAGKRKAVQAIVTRLYRASFKRATKVFFQNPDDAGLFRDLGLLPPALPVVIVNGSGVDLNEFRPAQLPTSPIQFLLIARLLSAKGIREYAAAAARVRAKYPQATFQLVGGADSNPDALAPSEVRAWQDAGTLTWHGEVDDVRPFIAACHVYVLPSYREGTPRSVLEAMAMGRPIITSDAPGCRETVVDGDNGFLVPPRAVEPLANAMERFLVDPELVDRMGQRSRVLAESKFDVAKVNSQMMREMELT